ncbi:MAG: hypothetical protein AAB263_03130 [Planctomycetota bacterium]
MLTLGLVILVCARVCNETTEINLANGEMRVVSSFLGCDFRETHVDAGLDWFGQYMEPHAPDRWIPYSENKKRLFASEGVCEKRIGMVYWDAAVLAKLLFTEQALQVELRKVANADYRSIWDIRSDYRGRLKR